LQFKEIDKDAIVKNIKGVVAQNRQTRLAETPSPQTAVSLLLERNT
jgi:hypothetical protein